MSRQHAACLSTPSAALACCLCRQDIDGLAIAVVLSWPTPEGNAQTAQRWAHRECLPRWGYTTGDEEEDRAHRGLDA